MARKFYGRRYAQAVFEIALKANQLDRWQADLSSLVSLTEASQVIAFLESPQVTFAEKSKLLSERMESLNPLVLNLVYLLIARGKLGVIGDIADEYQRLLDNYRGIEPAEVISALPLEEADEHSLAEYLGAVTGKKVVIRAKVDPGVIGGIVARVGGKLIDGSTRSKLIALKKALAQGS